MKTHPTEYRFPNGSHDIKARTAFLRREIDKCLLHHRADGRLFHCWYSATQKWIIKHYEIVQRGREPKSSPLPRRAIDPYAKRHREPVKVGDELAKVMPLFGEDKR
jgi:hypothetical protein